MHGLTKVLVVDESKSSRETLCSVLSAHCEQVIEATGIADAHRQLESTSGFSLVVTEAVLTDGDAGDLLMEVGTLSGPKPAVVVVASRPSPDEAKRVVELGALAYLAKPISFLDLSRVLKRAKKDLVEVAPRIVRKSLGTALVLEEDGAKGDRRREVASHVLWDIHDISATGAFLETRGPVRPGRELALGIVLEGQMLRVRVRVVRLQQPSWEHVSGIGVAFLDFEDGAKQELERFVAKHAKG
jgi:CheY-like chemotaxis protein